MLFPLNNVRDDDMCCNLLLKRVSRMTIPSTIKNLYFIIIRERLRAVLWGITCCLLFTGCRTGLDFSNFNAFASGEETQESDDADISDDSANNSTVGFASNWKMPEFLGGRKEESPRYRKAASEKAKAEYQKAQVLYDQKEYKQSEKAFKRIAKKYSNTTMQEDAMFMVAESQFMQKRYSWAQDSYDDLLDKYPSSRHVAKSTARLFMIAKTWLDFPDVVTSENVKQVNFEDPEGARTLKEPKKRRTDPTRIVPILPNFHDRSRPVFDTDGRALQALKSIWLNDPTGSLADDALMLAASHHLRNKEYLEADRLYKIIRDEYPKSPHLENAFLIGSHVKLVTYQGGLYDDKPLAEAEKLKKSSLRIFRDSKNRKRLNDELKKIAEAKAAHEWEQVVYWEKKGRPESVAIYCQVVMDEHPNTKYAEKARKKLAQVRALPKTQAWTMPELKPIQFPKLRPIKFPNLLPVPKKEKDNNSAEAEIKPIRFSVSADR